MDEEERASNERLLRIHRENLQRLMEKKAQFGLDVPMWVENQIKAEQESIALYEPLAPSQKQKEVAESKPIDLTTLFIQGTQIAAEQARQAIQNQDITDQNKQIIEQQSIDTLWRRQAKEVIQEVVRRQASLETVTNDRYIQEQEVRRQRQQEHDERLSIIEAALESIQNQVEPMVRRVNWIRVLLIILIVIVGLTLYLSTRGG